MYMISKELELYYDKNGVIVRDSSVTDIAYLRNRLRFSDIEEIWASHNKSPYEALQEGLDNSIECMTIVKDGLPIGMFGIVPSDQEDKAIIWFLGSDDLSKVGLEFIRHTPGFIGFLFHRNPQYQMFYNFVDARNRMSIKWLLRSGANISEAKAFGAENMLFHFFYFRRS